MSPKIVYTCLGVLVCLWAYILTNYLLNWRLSQTNQLKIVFCDVGQGDGAVVILGSWQMMIDTGKDGQVLACLAQVMPPFDYQIEVLVLTHPDNDHIGAAVAVINQYMIGEILMIPYARKTADFMGLYNVLLERNCSQVRRLLLNQCSPNQIRFPTQGEEWTVAGQLHIKVINPEISKVVNRSNKIISVPVTETTLQDVLLFAEEVGVEPNDLSIALFLVYGRHSFLFTGDMGNETEKALLKQSLLTGTTVLKVAHHGSKSSSSDEFLDVVRPEIAVISAGKNNTYGHPAPETVTRLRSRNTTLLQTQELGSITAVTDGTTLRFFSKDGEVKGNGEE